MPFWVNWKDLSKKTVYNAKVAHACYASKMEIKQANTDITIKRKLEKEVEILCTKNKKLR